MTAITLKESLRHWAHLFGYFLGVAVVGGAVAGGGIVVLRDVSGWPAPDVGVKLIAGAGLLGVGTLVLLAGLFTIVLVVVADGVRFGIDAAAEVPADETETDEETDAASVPNPAERLGSRRRIRRTPVGGQPAGRRTRPRTAVESPRGAQADPERGDAMDTDEDHWMKEVERDLSADDPSEGGQSSSSGDPESPLEESTPATQSPDRRSTRDEAVSERPPDERDGSAAETQGSVPTDRDGTGADEWVGAGEIAADEPADEADAGDSTIGEGDADDPTTTGDRNDPTASPVDEADAGVTPEAAVSEDDGTQPESTDEPGPAGQTDDPLAPDDFEPEPVERDPEESTTDTEGSPPDSTDSGDEQP